ncbi:MAG: glycerate kinase [Acidimicrobiia bacterium]|nr:glycerate kinase [Acidimicrobiia bacterium]
MTSLPLLREKAEGIYRAAVGAADAGMAVTDALRRDCIPLDRWPKVHVVAVGKAACAMAEATIAFLPPASLAGEGLVVTNRENVRPVHRCRVLAAGHPLPDQAGAVAAAELTDRVARATKGDLILVLISGGSSSLLPAPVPGVSLDDKIATTRLLLGCGADISEINTVRKHLSLLKGGGLVRMAYPVAVGALILSDVAGDDLSVIGSGPTVPDPTTFTDAVMVLRRHETWDQVPTSVRRHLAAGAAGKRPETPKPGDEALTLATNIVLGGNRLGLQAAVRGCNREGFPARIFDSSMSGEARDAAKKLAAAAYEAITSSSPLALVAGGETTVRLRGSGQGGRNQELALAFALATETIALRQRWVLLSGGTDGRDGPTDAAGGIVDPQTLDRIRSAGHDPLALLNNNDSYRALSAAGDLLITGPTGTNIGDIQILLVSSVPA